MSTRTADGKTARLAPGSHTPLVDLWDEFAPLCERRLPPGSVALVDRRVARLHPRMTKALARAQAKTLLLPAGEGTKSLRVLEKVLSASVGLSRSGTLLVVGGGTLGDLGTVAAHLIKRGVRLIQVPSTILAAVDSSVGGKGAVHAKSGGHLVKNAVGVFHYAQESWLCPALFDTLSAAQHREGKLEAWKMFACLSAPLWRKHRREDAPLETLISDARHLKAKICERDPYELLGIRQVLNFGHTFGHVLESLSHFAVSHGDAVGLGMLCALDVGVKTGATPEALREEVERALAEGPGLLGRGVLADVLGRARAEDIAALLLADKKSGLKGELRMVLLTGLGQWALREVPAKAWRSLLPRWQKGSRP